MAAVPPPPGVALALAGETEAQAALEGTPAGAFLEQEQKKLMMSIRGVLLSHQQVNRGKIQ